MWLVASQATYGLPSEMQVFVQALGLIALDFNFVRPGCTGLGSFSFVFPINVEVRRLICIQFIILHLLLYSQSYYMPFPMLMLELEYRFRLHRASFAGRRGAEDLREYEKKRRIKRMVQATMLLFDFSYEVLAVTGFKGVQCLWSGSGYHLGVDSSIVRYISKLCGKLTADACV